MPCASPGWREYNGFFAPGMTMANTAKLLLLQGGRCFYCREPLTVDDATLEHIISKAQGGDASESNTVACCAAMNHLLGNATPKEKLAAVLNAGGALVCPRKSVSFHSQPDAPPVATPPAAPAPAVKPPTALEALRAPMSAAFDAAAAVHQGSKANLSALGLELRKQVSGFSTKKYGHKLLGNLVEELGYRVDGQWAYRKKAN